MEKKLISALLINNANMKYCNKVTPDMFTDVTCRDIFSYFLQSYQLGLEVNIIDVQQNLQSDLMSAKEIGAFLKELISQDVLGPAEIKSVVKSIVAKYKAKELYNICSKASYQPKDIHSTLVEINKATEEMLKDEKHKGTSLSNIADRFKDYYGKEHYTGLRTGLYELDEVLIGLMGGDLTVLAARPAVGKSALSTQILEHVASKGKRVGYFNLEMTEQQIFERILARRSKIHLTRIRKAISFMPEEQEAYTKAVEVLTEMKNLVIFSGSYTATEIKSLCKNQNFDLVVVDYLQIVKPDKSYGNRVSEVGDISKHLSH